MACIWIEKLLVRLVQKIQRRFSKNKPTKKEDSSSLTPPFLYTTMSSSYLPFVNVWESSSHAITVPVISKNYPTGGFSGVTGSVAGSDGVNWYDYHEPATISNISVHILRN